MMFQKLKNTAHTQNKASLGPCMLFYKTHSSLNIGVTGNRYPLRMWISYKHVALKVK